MNPSMQSMGNPSLLCVCQFSSTAALGNEDNPDVDWSAVMDAIEGEVLAASTLIFLK